MFRFVCSATVLLLLCNLTPFLFQMELPSSNFPEKVYKHLKSEILQQIKDNLNIISRNQNKLYLTIEHLLYLSENEIISPDQSKIIWEYLSKNSNYEQSSEKPSIKTPDPAKINITIKPIISKPNNDIKNINSLSVIGGVILEYKTKLNFNQIIMITTLGIITFGFIFFLIFLALYRTERYGLMIFLLSFLLYNVLSLARNLQFQLGSYFMSGALLNVSFLLFNAIVHVSLIKLNMQKKVGKIKEIFNCEHHFSGKIIQTFMNLIFFFFALFFFHSQLAQLPFYVSFYSFIYLLSRKYESKLNKIFWPAWILFFSFFSILIIIFFYGTGRKNFIFIDPEELAQSLFLGDSQDIELNPDLQCFGLVFSCLILNILFPIYLYFQQNKVWKNYKAKEFSFYSIYKAIKSELNQEKLNLDINLVYHHVYAFVAFSLIYVGLRMKLSLMVLISSFSFQSYLCFIIKDGNLLWRIIFYVGSFCISNSLFLIGNMEDKFAKEVNLTIIFYKICF